VIPRRGLQIEVVVVEQMLAEHPKIAEVLGVGEPDTRPGERAAVVAVRRAADDKPALGELLEYLTDRGLGRESLPEDSRSPTRRREPSSGMFAARSQEVDSSRRFVRAFLDVDVEIILDSTGR
jgi:acyl-CoA synthetase (AMP-forming)/AMP-acid ligase II